MRRIMQGLTLLGASLLFTGCRHKQQLAPPPVMPPQVQVPLAPTPEPSTPPQVATVPVIPNPLPSKPVPKIKKPKKKVDPVPATAAPPVSAPVLTASAGPPPDASVIGALTAGADAAPAEKQKAHDAIVAVEKQLAGVPQAKLESQKEALARVITFLRQAHEALNTGDALGASTLATKAKLLLDDLSL